MLLTEKLMYSKKCFPSGGKSQSSTISKLLQKVLSLGKYRSCARLFATFQGLQWPQSALGICKSKEVVTDQGQTTTTTEVDLNQ